MLKDLTLQLLYVCVFSHENLSTAIMTRFDSNQSVQLHELAKGLETFLNKYSSLYDQRTKMALIRLCAVT